MAAVFAADISRDLAEVLSDKYSDLNTTVENLRNSTVAFAVS